jgi:hypothetical protein
VAVTFTALGLLLFVKVAHERALMDNDNKLEWLMRHRFPNYDLFVNGHHEPTEEEKAEWEVYRRDNAQCSRDDLAAQRFVRLAAQNEASPEPTENWLPREPETPERRFRIAITDEQARAAASEMTKDQLIDLCVRQRTTILDLSGIEGERNTAIRRLAERLVNAAQAPKRSVTHARKKRGIYTERWKTGAKAQAKEIWLNSSGDRSLWSPDTAAADIIAQMTEQNEINDKRLRGRNCYSAQEIKEKRPFPVVPAPTTVAKFLRPLRQQHLAERTRRANIRTR